MLRNKQKHWKNIVKLEKNENVDFYGMQLKNMSDEDLETFEARIAELIEVRREFAAASEAAQAAEEAKKAENEAVKAAEAALANAAWAAAWRSVNAA